MVTPFLLMGWVGSVRFEALEPALLHVQTHFICRRSLPRGGSGRLDPARLSESALQGSHWVIEKRCISIHALEREASYSSGILAPDLDVSIIEASPWGSDNCYTPVTSGVVVVLFTPLAP